jgi:hypothetical protein
MRYLVSEIIVEKMQSLDIKYPELRLGSDRDISEIKDELCKKIESGKKQ